MRDKENDENGDGKAEKKKMMAKFGKKKDNFEVEIKMKGKDGLIENFDENKEEEAKLDDGPIVI